MHAYSISPWFMASVIVLFGLFAAGGFTQKFLGEALLDRPIVWFSSVGCVSVALTFLLVFLCR